METQCFKCEVGTKFLYNILSRLMSYLKELPVC